MKAPFLVSCVLGSAVVGSGLAIADPIIINQDRADYSLQLDCKHISHGWQISPGETITMDEYKPGSDCKVAIYNADNPYGKDGDYDPKKRYSQARLKKDSECVIKGRRITCE